MGPVRPSLGTLGPSFGRVWIDLSRPPNLAFIQGFKAFSAMWVLSWLSRPLSGCLGPVPLAQGVGRKAQLRSHMVSRFLVFLYTTHFFHDFVFPASRGGSTGGPGAILKHFWDPPEAQNGPLEGPFSAPSTPHTYFYAFSVYLFTVQFISGEIVRWT